MKKKRGKGGYGKRDFLTLIPIIVILLFFVLFSNFAHVKQAWGSPIVASLVCRDILKGSRFEIVKRLFLGRCIFAKDGSSSVNATNWNAFSFVGIWIDDALWHRIVTLDGDDKNMKHTVMKYFYGVLKKAAQLAEAPSNTKLTFYLVNNNGSVIARGIIIGGEMIPNFVDPKHW
ncbi:MAG: hypothetical protein FVQ81_09680 [Candidatus Glassbacteria bacterium]|nr:hypothetical protein [Candidatus Glassbacteria bacterium]